MRRSTITALAALLLLGASASTAIAQQGPPDQGAKKQDEHGKSGEKGKPAPAKNDSKQKSDKKNDQAHREQAFHSQQQERSTQYRGKMDQRGQDRTAAQHQATEWKGQDRPSRSRYQQDYVNRVHQQDVRFTSHISWNDPHNSAYFAVPVYRYSYSGSYFEINEFGATQLRRAINFGYGEGYRMGQADRQDKWHSDYEDSYAFHDATYGYAGVYLDENEYRFYFREGFRRGYEDGFNRHYQYGRSTPDGFVVTASVMGGILQFRAIN